MTLPLRYRLIIGAAGIVLALAGAVGFVLWQGTGRSFADKPFHLAGILAATGLLVSLNTWRWRMVLTSLYPGQKFRGLSLVRVVLIGQALGTFVSMDVGSASSRVAYLARGRGMSLPQASLTVLIDRWFDVLALACLTPVSVLFLLHIVGSREGTALMALVALAVTAILGASSRTFRSAFVIGAKVLTTAARFLLRRQSSGQPLMGQDIRLSHRELLCMTALSFARVLAVGLRVWIVANALALPLSPGVLFLLVPLVQATLLVPFVPGGLGLYEAGWYGVLLTQGVSTPDVLIFVLWLRILSVAALMVLTGAAEAAQWSFRRSVPVLSGTGSSD